MEPAILLGGITILTVMAMVVGVIQMFKD